MSHFIINGGSPLAGEIHVQGSKNSALPLMAAAVLNKGITVLYNIPQILDVYYMMQILETVGCRVQLKSGKMVIDAVNVDTKCIPEKWTEKMRSGIMLLAPLLIRCKEVTMGLPGGCSIGKRPVDWHLQIFRQMGAQVEECNEQIILRSNQLCGCHIKLAYPSVGVTENVLMAAVGAKGITILENPAKEPEISQLCDMLRQLGSHIEQKTDGSIVICGGYESRELVVKNCADRIVSATWIAAVASAGGQLHLLDVCPSHMTCVLQMFERMGCSVKQGERELFVECHGKRHAVDLIETAPYPGFPTDVQSLAMAVLVRAQGMSKIHENVFEARFQTAMELQKMGAKIRLEDRTAYILGGARLQGGVLDAPDLRGGAALMVAALGVEGCVVIRHADYVRRGYEDFDRQLCKVGADVHYFVDEYGGNA